MTDDQLATANRVLGETFGKDVVATLDNGDIVIAHFCMSNVEIPITYQGATVPGFKVTVGPDDDWAESQRSFYDALVTLVTEMAKYRAKLALEAMADEARVKEWERDQAEASEYFALFCN